MAIALNVLAVFASSSLQEHEFLRAFAQQKDFSSSTFGSSSLVADIMLALRSIERAALQQLSLLEAEGSNKVTFPAAGVLSGELEALVDAEAVAATPWEWSFQAASLEQSRRLCRSVQLATADKKGVH